MSSCWPRTPEYRSRGKWEKIPGTVNTGSCRCFANISGTLQVLCSHLLRSHAMAYPLCYQCHSDLPRAPSSPNISTLSNPKGKCYLALLLPPQCLWWSGRWLPHQKLRFLLFIASNFFLDTFRDYLPRESRALPHGPWPYVRVT